VVLGPLGGDDFAMFGVGFVAFVVIARESGAVLVGAAMDAKSR
jgi:hypothetical protein